MPNRYIRQSAIESEAVNSLSWQGEVFYRRLLNRADDFGRFTATPQILRASIFPLKLDRVRDADISRLLAECETAGLLFVYSVDGKRLLVVNKWEKGRAKHSDYAEPPPDVIQRMKSFVYACKHKCADAPDSDSDSDSDTDAASDSGTAGARFGLPDSLNTAAFRERWVRWQTYWADNFNHFKPMPEPTAHQQLRELSQLGNIDAAIEAINNAIAKGFRKPAPAFTNGNAAPAPARKGQTAADVENLPAVNYGPLSA